MTRNYEMDLGDIFNCDHTPEIPVVEEGEIVFWLCRCGRRHYPKQVAHDNDQQSNPEVK